MLLHSNGNPMAWIMIRNRTTVVNLYANAADDIRSPRTT